MQHHTNAGKTQVWNRSGIRPEGCDALERIAQAANPRARVWRGSGETDLLPLQQGIVVLGTPLGDPRFHPSTSRKEGGTLLERTPMVTDLQSVWLILLHCASARANHLLRVVEPQAACARAHGEGVWTFMFAFLNINIRQKKTSGVVRICRWCWAEWASGAPHSVSRIGQVGQIVFCP